MDIQELRKDNWIKEVFDNAHDLIQIVELDGKLLFVNKSWSSLLEYSMEEILSRQIFEFVHEPHKVLFKNYRDQVIEGTISGEPIIFTLVARSGKLINVEGIITAKLKKDQLAEYTTGIFRDITVRKKNEDELVRLYQELKDKEQNLQQLLSNAPDAVIVINSKSHVTFWNPKAEAIFGWTAEEVTGKLLQNFIIPHQYREAHTRGMEKFLSSGEGPVLNRTIEITAIKKSGEEFYVSLTISPSSQVGELAFIAFIRDITEQKLNQLELEAKTKELEQFTHVSHHDLQEPLRKIMIFTGMVRSDSYEKLSQSSKTYFDKISEAANRMSIALKDILNYASLRKEEQFELVDLNEVIHQILNDLELLVSEKQASFKIDQLPVIKAIPHQMEQLFYNFVNNALKFSKPGIIPNINITSSIVAASDLVHPPELDLQRNYFEISISDNGIGFSNDKSQKIFEMFQRLHNKDKYAGTGIGLALCKKVVENHNGFIRTESTLNEGSTFTIYLPII